MNKDKYVKAKTIEKDELIEHLRKIATRKEKAEIKVNAKEEIKTNALKKTKRNNRKKRTA